MAGKSHVACGGPCCVGVAHAVEQALGNHPHNILSMQPGGWMLALPVAPKLDTPSLGAPMLGVGCEEQQLESPGDSTHGTSSAAKWKSDHA